MATITSFSDGKAAARKLGNDVIKSEIVIDATVTNIPSGDTVTCINVPKGALVSKVGVVVKTAEGGAATVTVGDGSAAAGWVASVDVNATGATLSAPVSGNAYAFLGGKLYSAADTIDIVAGAALDAAVFTVFAEYSIIESVANG